MRRQKNINSDNILCDCERNFQILRYHTPVHPNHNEKRLSAGDNGYIIPEH